MILHEDHLPCCWLQVMAATMEHSPPFHVVLGHWSRSGSSPWQWTAFQWSLAVPGRNRGTSRARPDTLEGGANLLVKSWHFGLWAVNMHPLPLCINDLPFPYQRGQQFNTQQLSITDRIKVVTNDPCWHMAYDICPLSFLLCTSIDSTVEMHTQTCVHVSMHASAGFSVNMCAQNVPVLEENWTLSQLTTPYLMNAADMICVQASLKLGTAGALLTWSQLTGQDHERQLHMCTCEERDEWAGNKVNSRALKVFKYL